MSMFTKVLWAVAVFVFLPALLVGGGFIIAAFLALFILVGGYVGRYVARVNEKRYMGAKSQQSQIQDIINSDSSGQNDWRKE